MMKVIPEVEKVEICTQMLGSICTVCYLPTNSFVSFSNSSSKMSYKIKVVLTGPCEVIAKDILHNW
jgi:hypothetical protein